MAVLIWLTLFCFAKDMCERRDRIACLPAQRHDADCEDAATAAMSTTFGAMPELQVYTCSLPQVEIARVCLSRRGSDFDAVA